MPEFELYEIESYTSIADLKRDLDGLQAKVGEKIFDTDAYRNSGQSPGLTFGRALSQKEMESCSFILTQEMLDKGRIQREQEAYSDYDKFVLVIQRPKFQFEIDEENDRKVKTEEYQRRQYEELKKKFGA